VVAFLFLLYDSIAYFFEHFSSLTILNLLKRLWFIFVPVCFIYSLITRFIGYKITLLANSIKIESLFGVKYIEHSCISSYSYYFNSTGTGVLLTIIDESKTETIKREFFNFKSDHALYSWFKDIPCSVNGKPFPKIGFK